MNVLFSELPAISPVYNDNLILTISGASGNTMYYAVTLVVNSITGDTFSYPAAPTSPFTANLNLSPLLATYFTSNVYIPSYPYQLMEKISNSIFNYYIIAKLYTANNTLKATAVTPTGYIFNGAYNKEDNFAITDYIINNSKGNFLTNWLTNREITVSGQTINNVGIEVYAPTNDLAFVNVLTGQYGSSYNTAFSGVKITRHQLNGSTSTITSSYTDNTTKTLVNINISPSVLNSHSSGFINGDTDYYTIEDLLGYTKQPMRINIVRDHKITNFYNFLWLNKLGGVDFYTFTKVSNQNYKISKQKLDQYLNQKVFYTDSQKSIIVQSQYLTSYMADKLKELPQSPAVYVWFQGKLTAVQIITASLAVLDKYPKDNFQQFVIEFTFNNRNYLQLY